MNETMTLLEWTWASRISPLNTYTDGVCKKEERKNVKGQDVGEGQV